MAGGIDVGNFFQKAMTALDNDGAKLQEKMEKISKEGEISQGDMLKLQFAMGQYNAKLEAVSAMTKSMNDMLKSLAQRSG